MTLGTDPRLPTLGSGNYERNLNARLYELFREIKNCFDGLSGVGAEHSAVNVSSDTTLNKSNYAVFVDATSGVTTITLPPVAVSKNRIYVIKKIDASGNAVTVDGDASETIDGATTQSLASQYDSITVICDGSFWWIND